MEVTMVGGIGLALVLITLTNIVLTSRMNKVCGAVEYQNSFWQESDFDVLSQDDLEESDFEKMFN